MWNVLSLWSQMEEEQKKMKNFIPIFVYLLIKKTINMTLKHLSNEAPKCWPMYCSPRQTNPARTQKIQACER